MSTHELLLYFQVIKKRWWLIVALCVVTTGTILFSFVNAPAMYKARVQFLVSAPPSRDVNLYPTYREPAAADEQAVTQANFIAVLQSSPVAVQAVNDLGLENVNPNTLLQGVTVEEARESQLIELTVLARSADEAALLANGLIDAALRYYGELRAMPTTSSRRFIGEQLESAQQELQSAQQAVIQFQIEHRMGPLGPEIDSQQYLISNLRVNRDEAEAQGRPEQVQIYERLIRQREGELQDLANLRIEYANLEAEVNRAKAVYDFLLSKQTEAVLKENEILNTSFVQIVEPAIPPRNAVSPFNPSILALGLGVSLVLGIMLSLLLEYLANIRLKTSQEKIQVQSV
jgi:uncharacterized protein involved in exopolysaccharide biosynthesis